MNAPIPPAVPAGPTPNRPDDAVPAGPDPAEDDLASDVWEVMSGFVHDHDPSDELRQALRLGRGTGRVRTLLSLASGPLSLAELAAAIRADAPYATNIVNELQALGLLSRTQDTTDRRRKVVELTDSGRAALRAAQDIIRRPPPALRDLPPDDLARLQEILARLD